MNQFRSEAIILRRTNYGEADRILNFLTPEHGKVSAIAKGIRRPKSKLAGDLELFAVSDITIFQRAGNELGIVTGARLQKFYGNILHDYDRMQLGYELIKLINKASETVSEPEFYYLLRQSFAYLDELTVDYKIVELWFRLRYLAALGVALNLATDVKSVKLSADKKYNFDFTDMALVEHPSGQFSSEHIKLLRLANAKDPAVLRQVSGLGAVLDDALWLVRALGS